MRWLACAALTLGVMDSLALGDWRARHAFRNAHFATEIFAVAVLALSSWVARTAKNNADEADLRRTPSWSVIDALSTLTAHVFAALGTTFEISRAWGYTTGDHIVFHQADAAYQGILSSDCQGTFLMLYGSALLAWVAMRSATKSGLLRGLGYVYLALGFVLLLGVLVSEDSAAFTAFINLRFLLELAGAGALAVSALLAWRSRRDAPENLKLAGAGLIAFNLLMLLAVVREIATCFGRAASAESGLARAAAVSGWLMVYAAALLVAGFWKRIAFVRWQGLVLIVFTIAKVFLYDMRNLSSVYRVLSFIGLGVLLMGVSFAYQKDWLSLRGDEQREAEPEEEAKL